MSLGGLRMQVGAVQADDGHRALREVEVRGRGAVPVPLEIEPRARTSVPELRRQVILRTRVQDDACSRYGVSRQSRNKATVRSRGEISERERGVQPQRQLKKVLPDRKTSGRSGT